MTVAEPPPLPPTELRARTGGFVRVRTTDLAGRRVVEREATTDLSWDLRDDAGRPVAAGVYLVRARDASGTFTRKLLVQP